MTSSGLIDSGPIDLGSPVTYSPALGVSCLVHGVVPAHKEVDNEHSALQSGQWGDAKFHAAPLDVFTQKSHATGT